MTKWPKLNNLFQNNALPSVMFSQSTTYSQEYCHVTLVRQLLDRSKLNKWYIAVSFSGDA